MLSRVADALYWMGRYLERAENVTRLLLVTDDLATEIRGFNPRLAESEWTELLAVFPGAPADGHARGLDGVALGHLSSFFVGRRNTYSVIFSLRKARENARAVREALSLEVFVSLNETYRELEAHPDRVFADLPAARAAVAASQKGLLSIEGAIDLTLSRDEGWFFLKLGQALERVSRTAAILRAKLPALMSPAPTRDLTLFYNQWRNLLRSLSSLENYRKIHGARMEPAGILPFLLFDPHAPRSLRYGAAAVKACLESIAEPASAAPVARLVGKLDSELSYADAAVVTREKAVIDFLDNVLAELSKVHDALDAHYFGV